MVAIPLFADLAPSFVVTKRYEIETICAIFATIVLVSATRKGSVAPKILFFETCDRKGESWW
jgi:hypothetical protein